MFNISNILGNFNICWGLIWIYHIVTGGVQRTWVWKPFSKQRFFEELHVIISYISSVFLRLICVTIQNGLQNTAFSTAAVINHKSIFKLNNIKSGVSTSKSTLYTEICRHRYHTYYLSCGYELEPVEQQNLSVTYIFPQVISGL